MAHQAGFDNVVATLGTALTPGQVALLTRYANRIALAYDVDAAGEKAGTLGVTRRWPGSSASSSATTSGVKLEDVRVVRLPDGKDPDEVVREAPDGLARGDRARPSRSSSTSSTTTRRASTSRPPPGGSASSTRSCPSIRDIADPLRRDEALQEVRRVSGVEERTLRPGPRAAARRGRGPGVARDQRSARITADAVLASPDALPVDDILRAVTPVEAELLRLLLLVPDQQLRVVEELGPDQLPSTARARAVPGDRPPARVRTTRASTRRSTPRRCWPGSTTKRRARSRVVCQAGAGPADARREPARLRGRPAAPRPRGRAAARAQRLQRGRPGGGRPGRRRRGDRPPDARTKARSTKRAGRSTDVETRPGCSSATGGNPCPQIRSTSNSSKPSCRARGAARRTSRRPSSPASGRRAPRPRPSPRDDDDDDDDDDLDLGPGGARRRRRRRRRRRWSRRTARPTRPPSCRSTPRPSSTRRRSRSRPPRTSRRSPPT